MDYEIYPFEAEALCRSMGIARSITMAAREKIDDADFAWPDAPDHPKYPIDTQEHLNSAAHLIGKAPENMREKIKAHAIRIAKRKGFKLPDSWQEEDKQDRVVASSATPSTSDDTLHPPATIQRTVDGQSATERNEAYHALYMPVTYMSRREGDEWIVEGQATAEVPDSFGTIFSYDASKKAFQQWMAKYANVREMHGKKAAGKGIDVKYDDQNRRILVRTRVSKAEPGVWTKFHEGVLNGFSIGTTRNYKMGRMNYQGKSYPTITDYELAELSYVDAPSCPGSDAFIVARADGSLSDIIDDSDIQAVAAAEEERAGKAISSANQQAIHTSIAHGLRSAKGMMDTCGCETCQQASKTIDPDNDGDVDWFCYDDPDNDADQMGNGGMEERMQQILERSLTPVYQRQQAFLARIAGFDTFQELQSQLGEIKAVLERVATSSTLDEVRAELSAVRDRVQKIENQPAPGGPVQHGARPGNGPYEKAIPLQPQQQAALNRAQIERETLERLQASGAFQTQEDQVAAAALLIRRMQ